MKVTQQLLTLERLNDLAFIAVSTWEPGKLIIGKFTANGSERQKLKAYRVCFRQGRSVGNGASPPDAKITLPTVTRVKFQRVAE